MAKELKMLPVCVNVGVGLGLVLVKTQEEKQVRSLHWISIPAFILQFTRDQLFLFLGLSCINCYLYWMCSTFVTCTNHESFSLSRCTESQLCDAGQGFCLVWDQSLRRFWYKVTGIIH